MKHTVTDLPGSYGLSGNSDEEIITADYIRSGQADLVCILVDASQLEWSVQCTDPGLHSVPHCGTVHVSLSRAST
ncbi:MAG: hypothetical protein IJI04_02770 [Lachnospiraceae bacterium]|nr:hypothetical protein [Lachnospiraceae bacterium]